MRGTRVFTVPAGRPFLEAVASAILKGDLPAPGGSAPDPLDLPDIKLLLPTRRATRAMQEAFLAASGGGAMTLPQIRPISASEEDMNLLAGLASPGTLGSDALDLAPAVSEIERRLVLTMLVQRWSQTMRKGDGDAAHLADRAAAGANTPAQAAHLAAELARLMDMVETENVPLDGLAALVPDEHSAHWQDTLEFLQIITAFWPAYLAEKKLLSPAMRRNRAILAEAERLAATPPAGPVIVAGVTGSVPTTVALMAAVARLPNGAIVLPGLDLHLDAESWAAIAEHPEHPQFGFHKLLGALGIERGAVQVLPGAELAGALAGREALITETMRPSGKTGLWQQYIAAADRAEVRRALAGVSLIEAPSAQDEAETVALILREAAETPGRTAALVSPDRLLARRVAVRLEAWGIRVDDSAGRPFAKTPPGTFLDLVIAAAAEDFAPDAVMALLKHPLTRLGLDAFAVRRAARALEIAAFRDVYLGRGLDGIADALARAEESVAVGRRRQMAVRRLWPDDWKGAHELIARLQATFAPLLKVFVHKGEQSLQAIASAHVAVAEAVCRLPEAEASEAGSPLWREEAGTAAADFFAGLIDPQLPDLKIAAADYADLYRSLIVGENVRPRVAVHPRLSIWGPFEARLQQTDVVILGSLNDGTWPEAADPGPWLNRPMRAEIGLPSPEEKIGYAAHDFTSLLGAPRVYITRAEKIDGVPTVPSRWLMRLEALLAGLGLSDALKPDQPWLGWARARDNTGERRRIGAPEPRPPLALRPRNMSVTRVETWLSNPYAIFARDILGLDKLPALGADPNAALRGNVVHDIMSRFAAAFPEHLPADANAELMRIARDALEAYVHNPRVAAFWLPRFQRFAQWFAESEPARRKNVQRVVAEVSGQLVIDAPAGPFTLSARADRIDLTERGIVITDYKTGSVPIDRHIADGLKPQLPLEAAIALGESGFAGVPRAPVTGLRYVRATGAEPPGEDRLVAAGDVAELAGAALASLAKLVARFDDEATPYRALRRARFDYDYDDYAHLARVAEWAVPGEDEVVVT
ncbi:MAG: double-strand break repair protein AddB [Hyphomicrobium sp.]|uniref:double-strand break repair protein AddB n=1 Tax=Hyphomicrobium sp. TaxID=82 RepID=UPI00132A5747|nr:double-strand break repair protein AddB [Hyphomicrobium sp.]KAB2941847.1 MAG: double-strand break repair protein AddB [Hyphomicrobium sp.]MBZ0210587.1 double-strand break repair protein AddB [Hyphomicrobium sp.]